MDDNKLAECSKVLLKGLKDHYDLTYEDDRTIKGSYLYESRDEQRRKEGSLMRKERQIIRRQYIVISFILQNEMTQNEHLAIEKTFDVTQPSCRYDFSPYQVLKPILRRRKVYHLEVVYQISEGVRVTRNYNPGDVIVGPPRLITTFNENDRCAEVGSIMELKILKIDLLEKPVNIIQLERFLNKYAPKKI